MTMRNIKLAIAFVALNIVDAVLTKTLASAGGYELNPIMRHALEGPEWVFWSVKIGATLIVTLLLLWLAIRFPQPIRRILTILVGVMTGICVVNLIGVL